jgi:LemA protein
LVSRKHNSILAIPPHLYVRGNHQNSVEPLIKQKGELMKTLWIVVGVIASIILLFVGCAAGANNTAVNFEENIQNSKSGITVQRQRQKELITKLVQVVEANAKFESGTQVAIAKLRGASQSGNVAEAQLAIKVVEEAYPTLQTNASFVQLMNELSISENLVTSFRTTYNDDVKSYKVFVRSFPNGFFLAVAGHITEDYGYLNFENTELPEQLFPSDEATPVQ